MIIERRSNEVVFRLSGKTRIKDLQDLADFFSFREISMKSKARQQDVDALVKKIKKGRWAKTKRRLTL
jgi:hypothetical protein